MGFSWSGFSLRFDSSSELHTMAYGQPILAHKISNAKGILNKLRFFHTMELLKIRCTFYEVLRTSKVGVT